MEVVLLLLVLEQPAREVLHKLLPDVNQQIVLVVILIFVLLNSLDLVMEPLQLLHDLALLNQKVDVRHLKVHDEVVLELVLLLVDIVLNLVVVYLRLLDIENQRGIAAIPFKRLGQYLQPNQPHPN